MVIKVAIVFVIAYAMAMHAVPRMFVGIGRLLGFAMKLTPTTARRVARFRRIRRGYFAYVAVCTLLVLACFLEFIINDKPLAIYYDGKLAFPAVKEWVSRPLFFMPISSFYKKDDFGQVGKSEVDYREFARAVTDPTAYFVEQRKTMAEEVATYKKENPPPAEDATDRTKQRWERGFSKIRKKQEDLEQRIGRNETILRKSAWILQTIYPYGPQESRLEFEEPPPNKPSLSMGVPLGTEMSGRDILVQLAYGFRISMAFALIITIIGTIVGVAVGAFQGYYGGWIDIISQRVVEIWAAIPFLYVIMIISAAVSAGFWVLVGLMVFLVSWLRITYFVRGEFYREKSKDYVQAAIGMGVSDWKVMLKHILPNSMVPIVTFTPFAIVGYISALVSLDYIGYGLPTGTPSWGTLLREGMENVKFHPHLIIIPTISLSITLYLIVLIGEAVREAFDPKVFSRLR